ncbi:Hypothetical Protein SLY_0085 [Strawberry lethal yellows phytoplasma (CPA) str. NZSb11]|uniref:Uncharacterized protein n=1 Tax=Strawberry lethal yellows phytoplasma (CPA) str. NZSb11 TaxID=980422 RepID=R4RNI2_PHYAS|nr:Hypothetical Protein SLY_0085 [Strawberry lethal yellows phytoplasma (CPA) str. NZSb11]
MLFLKLMHVFSKKHFATKLENYFLKLQKEKRLT